MKIIVFGASRGAGRYVVNQALEAGFDVTAVLRNPNTPFLPHTRLSIQNADVRHLESLRAVLTGHDAVISTIGPKGLGPTDVVTMGTANLIAAMRAVGIRRALSVSAIGVDPHPSLSFFSNILLRILIRPILKNVWADAAGGEAQWANSHLDWTIVRAPRLTHGPLSEKYRMSINQRLRHAGKISRADLADCILKQINHRETYQARLEVSY